MIKEPIRYSSEGLKQLAQEGNGEQSISENEMYSLYTHVREHINKNCYTNHHPWANSQLDHKKMCNKEYLDFMKKKLIVLMISDHKFVSLKQSCSAFNILQFEKPSLDCDLIWLLLLSDGFEISKWASIERECKSDDLFCNIIRTVERCQQLDIRN